MQYVIKQTRADGLFYWTGNEYADDMNEARYFNRQDDAAEELALLDKEERHNALIIAIED